MNDKQRRGLGRGLGALIPTQPSADPPHDPPVGTVPTPVEHQVEEDTGGAAGSVSTAADAPVAPSEPSEVTAEPQASPSRREDVAKPPAQPAGAYFTELAPGVITPNPRQPREVFDEEAMAELVHSVREVGLLQPVVVRPAGDGRYELIMGERRWRAAQQAGLDAVPAIVRQTGDNDMLRDALLENLHRSQLNPLEEAAAYEQLLVDFEATHEELAARIGRSRPHITNTLRLLRLSPTVQRRVGAGVLSAGHARALLAVEDPARQDRLAGRVVAEGISVRGLEELVAVGEESQDSEPRVRPRREQPAELAEMDERLSDRLETRVKVTMGRSKGRISVEFGSWEDLQRIADIIDPRTEAIDQSSDLSTKS